MQPPFSPVLVTIGPVSIFWYGLLIATGIMLGARVAAFLAEDAGENPDNVWDMLMVVVLIALVGARLYHVFSSPQGGMLGWDYYKKNPLDIFAIWHGGLGIYGALAGGALGVVLFCHFRKLNVMRYLGFVAPGAAIGQSIGRWGNYMNRELYGPPTTLPWGLDIPPQYRIVPYTDLTQYPLSTRFHPTFLYESLACFILCILLIWIATRMRDKLRDGDLLFGYLASYAVIRFFTEMLRPDAWMMGSLAAAQVFAIGIFVVCAGVLVLRRVLSRQRA